MAIENVRSNAKSPSKTTICFERSLQPVWGKTGDCGLRPGDRARRLDCQTRGPFQPEVSKNRAPETGTCSPKDRLCVRGVQTRASSLLILLNCFIDSLLPASPSTYRWRRRLSSLTYRNDRTISPTEGRNRAGTGTGPVREKK